MVKWIYGLTILLLGALPLPSSLVHADTSKAAKRAAIQKLQQQLWKAQAQFHRLLSKQHKHQLAMNQLRMQMQKLQLKQLKMQETHLKLMLEVRRSQRQQLKLQMELSHRRTALHQKAPVPRWYGYMVSSKTPVGPRMIMQHPLVRSTQQYINLTSRAGQYIQQGIIVFGKIAPPKRADKMIEITGKARKLSMGTRRPRVKGYGYKGIVITVTSWKYVK